MNWVSDQTARVLSRKWGVFHLTRFWLVVLIVSVVVLGAGGSLAAAYWPYRYSNIKYLLEDMFGNPVRIGGYDRVYFPHPGFVATDITILRPGGHAIGTVETMFAESYWSDWALFRRHIRLVEITRMHVMLPGPGTPSQGSAGSDQAKTASASTNQKPSPSKAKPSTAPGQHPQQQQSETVKLQFTGPSTPIDRLTMHDSILDILRADGGRYTFQIRALELLGLQEGDPWRYSVDMENALPAGHIAASGIFGPMDSKDIGSTPLSGQFTVKQLKLSDIGSLRGLLAGSGRFGGKLRAIYAEAISDMPDFAVSTGRPTRIHGSIRCTLNALNGDLFIHEVQVESGHTIVRAHGQVAGSPKITNLDIAMNQGRAEDALRPFIQDQVPVIGPATLHAHAYVAPPGKPFLQRMVLRGHFDAPSEVTPNKPVEQSLSSFSRREMKNAPEVKSPPPPAGSDVLSSIQGPATIKDGVISTPGVQFRVPGASATLHGTFRLDNEAVHLTGMLRMDAGISHAATGWKSFVLKFLQPFFHRKDHAGSQIPIAVVGTPNHYKVEQNALK